MNKKYVLLFDDEPIGIHDLREFAHEQAESHARHFIISDLSRYSVYGVTYFDRLGV